MNVLLITHEYPPIGGGGGNAARHLSRCLVEGGTQVTVLTSAFRDLPKEEIDDGVRVVRIAGLRRKEAESSLPGILAYASHAFITALGLPRPDIVHAFFGIPGGAVARGLKTKIGLPYVVSFRGKDVHGGMSRDFGGIRGMMKAVSLPVWRSADALVANSQGLKHIAETVDPTSIVDVIPNGVDTNRFTPGGPRPTDTVELLYVGRLEPYKGVETLLDALTRLRAIGHDNFRLRIVGDGSLRSTLLGAVEQANLSDHVRFSGWISAADIPKVYQDADIFILPSVVEGMPNGVLEAMASGLPCIASRVPGTEELIQAGSTGYTFEPGDAATLSDHLSLLIADPALRVRLGTAARAEAVNRSWSAVADAYTRVYESIVGRVASENTDAVRIGV